MLPIKIAAPAGYDLEFVFSGARGLRVGVFRSLNRFARDVGLLDCDLPYEDVVAEQFQRLWTS